MESIVSRLDRLTVPDDENLVLGYRAARIRIIFELPLHLRKYYSGKVAYVDWFNEFPPQPAKYLNQFQVSLARDFAGRQLSSVIPLTDIHLSCHLGPKFGSVDEDVELLPHIDIFRVCRQFYLNDFGSYFIYELIRHWKERLKEQANGANGMLHCPRYISNTNFA